MKSLLENMKNKHFKSYVLNGGVPPTITNNPGTYILLIYLSVEQKLRVGSLEEITFSPGYYVYVGSAMGGLSGRINRYLRPRKKMHWNIDYFLQVGQLKEIFILESKQKKECAISCFLAQSLLPAANRFGSTDCSCRTHLYFAPEEAWIKRILTLFFKGKG